MRVDVTESAQKDLKKLTRRDALSAAKAIDMLTNAENLDTLRATARFELVPGREIKGFEERVYALKKDYVRIFFSIVPNVSGEPDVVIIAARTKGEVLEP